MASINNFSLVGIGSSVKLGKGGIVLSQSNDKLLVGTKAVATEEFVGGQGYLTDAAAVSAGFLKMADITALDLVSNTALATALADYTTTELLEDYGLDLSAENTLKDDIEALGFATTTDLDLSQYAKIGSANNGTFDLGGFGIIGLLAGTLAGHAVEYSQFNNALNTKLNITTAASTYAPIASPTFTGTVTLAADPVMPLEAATKQYVDGVAAGLSFKDSVYVATTANAGTYNSGDKTITGASSTVDGEALEVGMRILVKSQTDAKENGIYVVTTVGTGANGVWTRAADADEPGELRGGTFIFVTAGTVNKDKGFVVTAPDGSVTIGTDNIVWTQYSSTGTVSLAAGTGIEVSGDYAYTINLSDIDGVEGEYSTLGKTIALTVDGQGRITEVAEQDIQIALSQVTDLGDELDGKQDANDGLTAIAGIHDAASGSGLLRFDHSTGAWTVDNTAFVTAADIASAIADKAEQEDLEAVIAGVGLEADGSFVAPVGVEHITESETVVEALADLDAALVALDGVVDTKAPLASPTFTGTVTVPTPTNNTDAATKKYVDDAVSGAVQDSVIPGATITKKADVTHSSSSVVLAAGIAAGVTITRVVVKVTTAFDATPTFSVLQNAVSVVADADVDLGSVGTYIIDYYGDAAAAGDMTIAIANGGTVGAASVFVEYVNPISA